MTETNPLLTLSQYFDGAVPFDQIKEAHFLPALELHLQAAKKAIAAIKANPAAPTFENTILAMDLATDLLEWSSGIFFNLLNTESSESFQALAQKISPLLAQFQSDVSLDEGLFRRIKILKDTTTPASLTPEEWQILDKNYKDFVRNGAMLNEMKKTRLREIDQELSVIGLQYSDHLLKATNAFSMLLTDEKDLAGLPEGAKEAALVAAKGEGWLFNLQFPSFGPFLQFSERRELREKMWRAYSSRCFNDPFDNQKLVLSMVRLRKERAELLGFPTYANFVLEERMAEKPERVFEFLQDLIAPSHKAALRELEELKLFSSKLSGVSELKPWDLAFYSEKLKEHKFHFHSEELRPYFQLENVVQGMFEHARRLYNLSFSETKDVPVYHKDVRVFKVIDENTKEFVALFYADFFPRESKRGGAWMTNFREQGLFQGKPARPHVGIVCNFTKPTGKKPSLLNFEEVTTIFHEFGHALHSMLSQVKYRRLSGVNVYWDFVELPSQIMENWVVHKESLDLFAHHFETNELIPEALVKKIKDSSKFQSGMSSLRQLSFALLDMLWHSQRRSTDYDVKVDEFEDRALMGTRLLEKVAGSNGSCSFSHIFAGGYSAGYYSYKWAEVLDADAFEFFQEKGLFNREVADAFHKNILSQGGTKHPLELYRAFRGRDPDPKALLRREGLI